MTTRYLEIKNKELLLGIIAVVVIIVFIVASILYDKNHKERVEDFAGTYIIGNEEFIIVDLLSDQKSISQYSNSQGNITSETIEIDIPKANCLTIKYESGGDGAIEYIDGDEYSFINKRGENYSLKRISEATMVPPDE